MPDRDPVTQNQRIRKVFDMETRVVLHVRFIPDADVVDIAANGHVRPDAGPLPDHDVADDLGAGVDVSGCGNPGQCAAIGTNH